MLYTTSDNVPHSITAALEDAGSFDGVVVAQMLCKIAKLLDKAMNGSQHNPLDLDTDPMDIDGSDQGSELEEEYESDADSVAGWSPRSPAHPTQASGTDDFASAPVQDRAAALAINRRIRSDLKLAKEAGFRVGHLGGLVNNAQDCFVTLSIRVAKLGISEEAMQAWHLEANQYLLLLIRYSAGYRNLDQIISSENSQISKKVGFRVGLSQRYKMNLEEAIDAFSGVKRHEFTTKETAEIEGQGPTQSVGLKPLFIGRPLEELMNERLLSLIRTRTAMGFGWNGAEEWYTDFQGRNYAQDAGIDDKYYAPEISVKTAALPKISTADHLSNITNKYSFPLVAMQFVLRHLVRCTEFCLVCHCKVEADFEALKPYVCSKPLCLYQYMALGFGPSIDHEIISQPQVVDLLVSFCYSSASSRKLKSLPNGMSLSVPSLSLLPVNPSSSNATYPIGTTSKAAKQSPNPEFLKPLESLKRYKAKFDQLHSELILEPGEKVLYPGQWIYLTILGLSEERYHCRVVEAMHPTVRLGPPAYRTPSFLDSAPQQRTGGFKFPPLSITNTPAPNLWTPAATPPPPLGETTKYPEAEFIIYDQNFDDLHPDEKQGTICMLLDTLPSISKMKEYLQSKSGKDMTLQSWHDRISPAAAGVLRWIIASNRSCIIQIDKLDGESSSAPEERVSGMPQWMQFRFAQGAPDKEQRFIQSIRDVTIQLPHPSIFAWHGSPLHNWHSIVREGLHFEETLHGRAFGNGVYHATHVQTSLGYSQTYNRYNTDDGSPFGEWPSSQLRISAAVALNEIVNAPSQFVSRSPHLVVAQLDWIQTRYLFVKTNTAARFDQEILPTAVYDQDTVYTPVGANGQKIVIPITAVSKSRRPTSKIVKKGDKKARVSTGSDLDNAILLSDDTDIEDLQILISDGENEQMTRSNGKKKEDGTLQKPLPELPKTDFVPGTLDHQSLPMLEPPPYATSSASKALQRELASTLKIQDSYPAHELGWYINPELINNMYQWIVELHSFEIHLPLAKDMKAKGINSVVMEIRFGKDYPMSPPFVRIIRPRFLSFMQGGGGHVTAGGALCMELLTNSGWSAVSNIESVLLQVRLALSSTDPKPARLENGVVRDYGVGEAIEAYIRACNTHGVGLLPSSS